MVKIRSNSHFVVNQDRIIIMPESIKVKSLCFYYLKVSEVVCSNMCVTVLCFQSLDFHMNRYWHIMY